jgi:hypothetical protein
MVRHGFERPLKTRSCFGLLLVLLVWGVVFDSILAPLSGYHELAGPAYHWCELVPLLTHSRRGKLEKLKVLWNGIVSQSSCVRVFLLARFPS